MQYKTGADLASDISDLNVVVEPLIDDFLYANTVTMWAAEPGAGKSALATQLAICLSSATPLFDSIQIPSARRVYYIQLEGSYAETIDRLRHMQSLIPINTDNLAIDMLEGINIMKANSLDSLELRIKSFGETDLIIIDPIYMAIPGGLSKDEPASRFVQFCNFLRNQFNCAILLLHHTHRVKYDKDGKKVDEDDPFYGSQWLKAHVDVAYIINSNNNGKSITFRNKKGRAANVFKHLELYYRPESMTNYVDASNTSNDAVARVIAFLNHCKMNNKTTDFWEIHAVSNVSVSHLRRISRDSKIMDMVNFVKSNNKKTLWKMR